MGHLTKAVTLTSALAGLALFSQAPEFAQQYRQRIGGAVDELKTVVVNFDEDAATSQLSRSQALEKLSVSNEQFSQDRGASMSRTIKRYQRLGEQMGWLEKSHPFTRPLLVLKSPDGQLITRAWEIFEPAVPLTGPGALYGGLGGLLAIVLARFGIGGARRVVRGRKKDDSGQLEVLAGDGEHPPDAEDDVGLYPGRREPGRQDFSLHPAVQTGQELQPSQLLTPAKGVPGSMQVAPVSADSVTYLKAGDNNKEKT